MQKYFDLARCPACHNISHSFLWSLLCAKLLLMWEAVNRKQECTKATFTTSNQELGEIYSVHHQISIQRTLWVCYYKENLFETYVKKLVGKHFPHHRMTWQSKLVAEESLYWRIQLASSILLLEGFTTCRREGYPEIKGTVHAPGRFGNKGRIVSQTIITM